MGAKVIVIGDFTKFARFSSLFIRAVDVKTAQALAIYSANIDNNDSVLLDITKSLGSSRIQDVSEVALSHLYLGKEYSAAGLRDIAIKEYSKAISISRNLVEAYLLRGYDYIIEDFPTPTSRRAIADFDTAIRLDPNNAYAYYRRGIARNFWNNEFDDRAIADFTIALRLYSNEDFMEKSKVHESRGMEYFNKNDPERARNDFIAALRFNPNNSRAIVFLQWLEKLLKDGGVRILDNGRLIIPANFKKLTWEGYREAQQFHF